MSRNLSVEWTKHLNQRDDRRKEDFESAIRNSTVALSRLKDIVDEHEQAISRHETRIDDYMAPDWAYRQAHRNGVREEIRKLKELLAFLE